MGYWEEKRRYKELLEKKNDKESNKTNELCRRINNCTWCGTPMKDNTKFIVCQHHSIFFKGKFLCDNCAKKCKKCGRFFCPGHINNHGCE